MITQLRGNLEEIAPTYAVVDCSGVGYMLYISLNTYSKIKDAKQILIYTQFVVREDAHLLFGFADKQEREMFLLLTSVSGVGASTARMILSAMNPAEVQGAILMGDVRKIKSVKGIGEKSAQRIIVDLKDKVGGISTSGAALPGATMSSRDEALAALTALGFSRLQSEKAIEKTLMEASADATVEQLIKIALKHL
jgi:Holliday junction DNA helicase RuvA